MDFRASVIEDARRAEAVHPRLDEFAQAAEALLARRRQQRAGPTWGDDADARLATALASLRLAPAELHLARATLDAAGARLGAEVYARRFYEDSVQGAIVTLSATFHAGHLGTLECEDAFHRAARVAYHPAATLQGAPDALDPFVAGALRGYLAECLNCRVDVGVPGPHRFDVRLGEGRDVNRRAQP